jgi:CheY-like chemotaxis protein
VVSLKGEPGARRLRRSSLPILIVEDDFAIRHTLANVLTEEGYDVTAAADGREALSLLAEGGFRPRLIVLDLWMPSMNGLEFRELQKDYARWADIPVLVITASQVLPSELASLGLTNVLQKPLQLEELLAKAEELMSAPAAPPS